MEPWPKLELSPYEQTKWAEWFVPAVPNTSGKGGSADPDKPPKVSAKLGVLGRHQQLQFSTVPQPDAGIPTEQLIRQFKVSRRTRIYGLTVVGDVSAFFLRINTAAGQLKTPGVPEGNAQSQIQGNFVLASAYWPGILANSLANINEPLDQSGDEDGQALYGQWAQNSARNFYPGWTFAPNNTLIFEVRLTPRLSVLPEVPQRFLEIGIHYWEFPRLGDSPGINI